MEENISEIVCDAFEEFEKKFNKEIREGKIDKERIEVFIQEGCPKKHRTMLTQQINAFIVLVYNTAKKEDE